MKAMTGIRFFNVLIAVILFGGALQAAANQSETRPPNFVVIVADDLGLECVQAYGGLSYKTPNIDKLASQGMRFTHCFGNPYCSPSRATLLTGRYPLRHGIKRVIYDPPKHREFLDPAKETSFAKLLKAKGYATAMAGKWQVSFLHERDTVTAHGFDEYQCWQLFHNGKKTSRYVNPTFRRNGKVLSEELRGKYGPDVNVDFLIDFMKRNKDKPFCVYYTSLLPHWPWEPTPDSSDPLKSANGQGDTKYMPDMVAYLDKLVGRMVAAVDELGLSDNTVIMFTGDNGTDRKIKSKWTDGKVTRNVAGGKGTLTDAGTRVPLIVRWPAMILRPGVSDDLIDFSDLLPTLIDLAGGNPPLNINGVSFAPKLNGQRGDTREWIHAQLNNVRHVREQNYILTSNGQFRSVVDIGKKQAKPIGQGSLNTKELFIFARLQAALEKSGKR